MFLAQSGDQTDIFWRFYSPADTLWSPKTVWRVLGYTTASRLSESEDQPPYCFQEPLKKVQLMPLLVYLVLFVFLIKGVLLSMKLARFIHPVKEKIPNNKIGPKTEPQVFPFSDLDASDIVIVDLCNNQKLFCLFALQNFPNQFHKICSANQNQLNQSTSYV